ncbi:MAG: hypothetical protein KA712_25480 [Myxococcales bacterium]|nr:hypothetical protein [Myxococcales bacterium]
MAGSGAFSGGAALGGGDGLAGLRFARRRAFLVSRAPASVEGLSGGCP